MEGNRKNGTSGRRLRETLRCREAILSAAAELFAHNGYENTSMKRISEHAELSVGKLYSHFEGKEEILRALIVRHIDELQSVTDGVRNPGDAPMERVRKTLAAATAYMKEHPEVFLVYLNENPLILGGLVKEEISKKRETLMDDLAEAMDRGDIPAGAPAILATVMMSAVQGLAHMLAESGRVDDFDDIPAIMDRLLLRPLEAAQGDR